MEQSHSRAHTTSHFNMKMELIILLLLLAFKSLSSNFMPLMLWQVLSNHFTPMLMGLEHRIYFIFDKKEITLFFLRFAQMWGQLAKTFATKENILGYELFNEPVLFFINCLLTVVVFIRLLETSSVILRNWFLEPQIKSLFSQ